MRCDAGMSCKTKGVCGVDSQIVQELKQQCYSITKLIYLLVLRGSLYKLTVYIVSRKMHGPLRLHIP